MKRQAEQEAGGDDWDELLEKCQSPEKKAAKREKKEKKRVQALEDGKKYAASSYNMHIPESELDLWASKYKPKLSLAELEKRLKQKVIPQFQDLNEEGSEGFYSCLHYIKCYNVCEKWLHEHLNELGWSENMTGYKPVQACSSVSELLQAYSECYRMAVKQAVLLCKRSSN